MARILIADDHHVLREGLRTLLENQPNWEVVAEACDGLEVLPLIEKFLPDILILDLSMPHLSGLETIQRIQRDHGGKPAVLVLSATDDGSTVNEVLQSGAKGFLPKSSRSQELYFAVQAVLEGQVYVSPSVCESLMSAKENGPAKSPLEDLSVREREIMKLLSEGHPNREVAKMLHISPRTIDSHRTNIMRKLDIDSNAEMVQLAVKFGLIG